jgi:ribose 5-phosphate isomerase A
MTNLPQGDSGDPAVVAAAAAALELVSDGACVGLGSGRASFAFIRALGTRIRNGLRVSGVAASSAAADLAATAGVPLTELGEGIILDLTVDGADEVAPTLDLVKGWGGALVRERILAASSKRQVIVVGAEKLVATIGQRGRIPVEIIPMARGLATRAFTALDLVPTLRMDDSGANPYLTDNGNVIVDVTSRQPLTDHRAARALEHALLDITGVVDTGLFLGTAERVYVGHPDGRVDTLLRPGR